MKRKRQALNGPRQRRRLLLRKKLLNLQARKRQQLKQNMLTDEKKLGLDVDGVGGNALQVKKASTHDARRSQEPEVRQEGRDTA
jgi:hypothetical protein